MTEKYADNWFAWSSRGDAYAHRAMYDEAIEMYREAIRLQERPRFTDNESSIAQLCRLKGDWKGAMEAYGRVIDILREDWDLTDGEDVRRCREKHRSVPPGARSRAGRTEPFRPAKIPFRKFYTPVFIMVTSESSIFHL